jgi:hypothetical protein
MTKTDTKERSGDDLAYRNGVDPPAKDSRQENERLPQMPANLDRERNRNAERIFELEQELELTQLALARHQQHISMLDGKYQQLLAEQAKIEQQNTQLTNLYVAGYRLSVGMDRSETLAVIHEIIINLIGSEELAIFEVRPRQAQLGLLSCMGVDSAHYATISLDESPIGKAARSGLVYFQDPPPTSRSAPTNSLSVCIPLKISQYVIGVIAIFRMLPQKAALAPVDHLLFDLLGTHAAMALYCSSLHAQNGRLP